MQKKLSSRPPKGISFIGIPFKTLLLETIILITLLVNLVLQRKNKSQTSPTA